MIPPAAAFLAACWLSAGDVVPFRARTHSRIDIRARIEAVARAGHVGVTQADIPAARYAEGLRAVAAMLDGNGITTVQLKRL